MASAARLVALRALGLGDVLTAVPALRALARAFPRHERMLVAPAELEPIARLAGWPIAAAGELEPLPPAGRRADVAVNLHGRGPQSHRLILDSRPRRVLWLRCEAISQSAGAPSWRPGEHEVARWCRMLTEYGIEADPAELDLDPPPGEPPPGSRGATLIHPGAASAARRWPADRFAAVARAECEAGRPVVVTGGPAELALARRVAHGAGLGDEAVLAGRTDLAGLARAVAAAARVVCGDTGVGHLATALGTPSVVLFGPVPPAEWGPPAGRPIHTALWTGRRGDPHADRPDPGLLEIEAERVLEALPR
jgi:ADP-heptose:LPS heptosyltransferase